MYRFIVVVACVFSLSSAEIKKQLAVNWYAPGGYDGGGPELSSLAHNSAVEATNILHNQQATGNQAAHVIKSSLASAAQEEAQAAKAAVLGKQTLIANLKQALGEAEDQLQAEISEYHQTEKVVQTAKEAAKQAQSQLQAITAAVAAAHSGIQQAQQAAAKAANSAAVQQNMIEAAKQRINHILAQLQQAHADLKNTEVSAVKAAEAAYAAQTNAAAAGAAVIAAGVQAHRRH